MQCILQVLSPKSTSLFNMFFVFLFFYYGNSISIDSISIDSSISVDSIDYGRVKVKCPRIKDAYQQGSNMSYMFEHLL